MADDPVQPGSAGPWAPFDTNERRVLGVLIEKQKTLSSDAYPMSINAIVTGCNQKSNRDPILDLEEDDAEEALMRCKARGLTAKIIGGRVERWRHLLYEAWSVNKVEMAVLGELLLRGPQTEGELRGRASRMDAIEDLETLRAVLKPLVERNLVIYLTPEGRGAMLTHGFHEPGELGRARQRAVAAGPPSERPAPAVERPSPSPAPSPAAAPPRQDDRVPALESALATVRQELESSRQRVAALEKAIGELRQELLTLKQSLGG